MDIIKKNYKNVTNFIASLNKFGCKPGLSRITKLLYFLKDPHLKMKVIHVGGTNGKGSTSIMIESALRRAGFMTGLFTSPHLISPSERIKVNGECMPDEAFAKICEELIPISEDMAKEECGAPTEFEIWTAICFKWFEQSKVEVAVIEVGLGGLLDSTNVVVPDVCVITPISNDHGDILGNSIEEIAEQKAGIIKRGANVVLAHQSEPVRKILLKKANMLECPVYEVDLDVSYDINEVTLDFTKLNLVFNKNKKKIKERELNLCLRMIGEHQAHNAACAVLTLFVIRSLDWKFVDKDKTSITRLISDRVIENGVSEAYNPGRFEVINDMRPLVILDGAHNEEGMKVLSQTIARTVHSKDKILALCSISKDKSAFAMLDHLYNVADCFIFTKSTYTRSGSHDPLYLCEHSKSLGYDATAILDMKEAFSYALSKANASDIILVCGSLYLVGEIKELLLKKRN